MKIRTTILPAILLTVLSAILHSCTPTEELTGCNPIVIKSVAADQSMTMTRGIPIEGQSDLQGKQFGIYCLYTPTSSSTEEYFQATATVNDNYSASLSSAQYWPLATSGSMKFFSWYPSSTTVNFPTLGQMKLSYTADADAVNHVDVLAALSEPSWKAPVDIHFYHTLTKVTFTFQKEESAADITVSNIAFQQVGKSGELIISQLPPKTTKNNKPKFVWTNVTNGEIASALTGTVTTTRTQLGDTFLMLPTDSFDDAAKIIITTNRGTREFLLKDIDHSWESGEYINYNITLTEGAEEITAQPLAWTDNPINVIFDRDYYLEVSESVINIGGKGDTVNLTVKTNYDANPDTGHPAGASMATLDDPNVENNTITLSNSDYDSWATATLTQISNTGGIYKYNLRVVINDFPGGDKKERWAGYYINAGNLRHRMAVLQYQEDGDWLTARMEEDTSSSSLGRYKIVFTSAYPEWWKWRVSSLSDPNDIFLNKETIAGATGGNNDAIYFYFKQNAVQGNTATLTLTNTNGSNAPVTIEITAP